MKPIKERNDNLSWKKKYPTKTVKRKFTPVAIGMINEKLLKDNALNRAKAEAKINTNAIMNGRLNKNWIQSLRPCRSRPFNCHLIRAAPETFNIA